MNHEHEVRHLTDVDRRKFLQLSGLATGLVFANSILSLESAAALPAATLPGFYRFCEICESFQKR